MSPCRRLKTGSSWCASGFPRLCGTGRKNAERVHQLRVATRRAAAALDLYHDFVPRKIAKKMDARLKRIRRTAGDIRDCDMLLARFSSGVAQRNRRRFIKRTDSQRVAAYRDLCRLHQNHSSSGRLKRQTRKLLAKTRHKAERRPRLATQKFDAWALGAASPLRQ